MKSKNKILGFLEQSIMDVVWSENKPLKVSEVQKELDDEKAYTSVMTVMNRLVQKKLLSRSKKKNYYVYSANKTKQNYAANKVKEVFGSILNSYESLAIAEFVNVVSEDPKSLKMLKEYLENNNELSNTKKD